MSGGGQRILVVGRRSPLLEGVSDLLQLAGYDVRLSATWPAAEQPWPAALPELILVDTACPDTLRLCQQLPAPSQGGGVPILLMSFAGDECLRQVRQNGCAGSGRVEFYTHTLLGLGGLLDKVRGCLAKPALVDWPA